MMRRLVLQGLQFFAVVVVVYLVVFWVLCHIRLQGHPLIMRTSSYYQPKGGVAWKKFQEFDTTKHWDAIVIGSSHAYRGYDPRLFAQRGVRMFNLGSSAQSPMNSYYVLRNYLSRKNTGLVIMDLYENAFEDGGMESTSELTRNITSDRAAVEMAIGLRDVRAVNMLALRFILSSDPPTDLGHDYAMGGFAERNDSVKTTPHYDLGRPLVLDPRQVDYFKRCIQYCSAQKIPMVLVTHFFPHASDHARHAAFHAFVDSIIASAGLRYLDFAYDHTLSDTDNFYDHNHMNQSGVRIFNERLLDSLESQGYLKPVH